MGDAKEYILGTGADELHRLGTQHKVWSSFCQDSWKRAGLSSGHRVLDVGCGPGYATADLARLVGPQGKAFGIDESSNFVGYVNSQSEKLAMPWMQAETVDILNFEKWAGPQGHKDFRFDFAFCRWVMCWLKNPEIPMSGLRSWIKPGGKLIIHDYFNWRSMATAPRSAALEELVKSAILSFEERHGDVDVMARLLPIARDLNYKVTYFKCEQKTPRGGGVDQDMNWFLTWWRSYSPKLVEAGKLSRATHEAAMADLARVEKDPCQFFVCPPVYELHLEV